MAEYLSGEEHKHRISSAQSAKKFGRSNLGLIIIIAIVALSIGFFSGLAYQKGQGSATSSNRPSSGVAGGGFRSRNRLVGTVTAVSASSITVSSRFNASNSTLNITSSTQITDNGQSVSYTDISTGELVIITKSSTNASDAAIINVNPSFGGYGQGSQPSPSTTTN